MGDKTGVRVVSLNSRRRRRHVQEVFPGMPDRVRKKPLKATAATRPMTLDQAIERSHEIITAAIAQFSTGDALVTVTKKGKRNGRVSNYGPREIAGVYALYSGGNDSVVLPHLLQPYLDGIIHVNTGTAIPETTRHVREVVPAAWGLPLHELHPAVKYRDLVLGRVLSTRGKNKGRPVWIGFPGPGGDSHDVMYQRLKGQPLEAFRTRMVGGDGIRKKVLYIAGTRWAESDRRFRLAGQVTVQGGVVWVAPLIHWTNDHMQEYRNRHRCEAQHEHAPHRLCFDGALPLNEVTEHLHGSGDCKCGSFAHEGEKQETEFFYPGSTAWIDTLEDEAREAGIAACRWGQRPPGTGRRRQGVRTTSAEVPWLCAGCVPGQQDLPGEWERFLRAPLTAPGREAS
jgi:3'-phosphoadenosine 5'-phosphosulfate sulfotransferase (PAPS reductase)/FAD synthetase